MKLLAMIATVSLLAMGIFSSNGHLGIAGVALYLGWIIFDGIVMGYFAAKAYSRANSDLAPPATEEEFVPSLLDKLGYWLKEAIGVGSLIMLFVGIGISDIPSQETRGILMGQAGFSIWIGLIVCYVLQGIIVREVGGVPLEMGRYGGWKIRRGRNLDPW